jgi:hypothetical protein
VQGYTTGNINQISGMPARVPGQPMVRQHVPLDITTLARVRSSMHALGWTPANDFTGVSVIDTEAARAQAAEAGLRHG